MANKQPKKNKGKFNQEETLIREVNYDTIIEEGTCSTKYKPPLATLDKLARNSNLRPSAQKVIISIKQKAPAIKTLYIAERNRFHSIKNSASRLGVGDHSSITLRLTDALSSTLNSEVSTSYEEIKCKINKEPISPSLDSSSTLTKSSDSDRYFGGSRNYYNKRRVKKCHVHRYLQNTMTLSEVEREAKPKSGANKVDRSTCIKSKISFENIAQLNSSNIDNIYKKIDKLEKKILVQEMMFRSMDSNLLLSSSDDKLRDKSVKKHTQLSQEPGCSYVEYSHVPETSAFQRYSQQPAPLSASKATTIQKEHNSEQYGRDFTLYDNVTARGRRQCASVPCKRNDIPKLAAERVHKIRHKLNPVRDYRLMDTVHYLAQGEFAPRDDGIKLTPSREAVLSDIIYEDVCRTHWPNTRLGRRVAHQERCNTRSDLQRLIDSLLRERVAHIERRRRRHYRIVKLNNRHANYNSVGKTGDIIVASHKNNTPNESLDNPANEHREDEYRGTTLKSNNHNMLLSERRHRHFKLDDSPGPSYAKRHSTSKREPTCCYIASHSIKPSETICSDKLNNHESMLDATSGSSVTTGKIHPRPRLVVKKNSFRKKYNCNEPNLEHFILLPTLVVRTPSNIKRQKKFNQLYHRILKVQLQADENETKSVDPKIPPEPEKRDISFNINITLSQSEEEMRKK